MKNFIFKFMSKMERIAAFAQGKGYGTASIRQENKLIHSVLPRKPKIAIDIGGNIGEYTAELRRINPDLEIHTFEPAQTNIVKLNERFGKDKNIYIVPFAVSDKAERTTLYSDQAGSGLGSLVQRRLDHFNIDFNVKESIQTIRFEDYWKNNLSGRHLDIVKIDIEGHEYFALSGFGDAIQHVSAVQFEFGGCNIDTRTYFQDFWYFFKNNNFLLYRITPFGLQEIPRYRESDEFFSTTNFIAVSSH